MHEKRIEIRWRDVDAYRHVNNAVYATYLEEGRDEWLEHTLAEVGSPWDYVLARVAIDFRRELRLEDEEVVVKSFRNLERVLVTVPAELEVAAVVWARAVVVTEAALPLVEQRAGKEASA